MGWAHREFLSYRLADRDGESFHFGREEGLFLETQRVATDRQCQESELAGIVGLRVADAAGIRTRQSYGNTRQHRSGDVQDRSLHSSGGLSGLRPGDRRQHHRQQ